MSALGKVLRKLEGGQAAFHCPGCKYSHAVGVEPPAKLIWTWNGSGDKPTFTPSILVTTETWTPPVTPENIDEWKRAPWPQTKVPSVYHSFVTDGRIQFLGDCTHVLAGQTVDLPAYNE